LRASREAFVRFAISLCLMLLAAPTCGARPATRAGAARELAESTVRASGPLRVAPASNPTPAAWRADRPLACTYLDPPSRHRFTRYTWGWPTWYGRGWHGCAPYRSWCAWYGHW